MREVGEILTELRKEKGLNQKELAALLNLSVGTISNYENDVHAPDLKMLRTLADFFGVTTDYLLGRIGYRCPPETLKKYITTDYTVTNFVNIVLSLDPGSRHALITYANYLNHLRHQAAKSKKPN